MISRDTSVHRRFGALAAALLCLAALASPASAAPGALVASIPLATPGFGVSVAVGCDATPILYYTTFNNLPDDGTVLQRMTPGGVGLAGLPIRDPANAPVSIDEMAYELSGDVLWGCEHGTNPVRIWRIDRATGFATLAFTSATISAGTFRDGITVDNFDGTIFVSGDVSTTVEHYSMTGVLLNVLTPKDALGFDLGAISGIQVGLGDMLYLGRNGFGQIVQVKKSDGSFISSFASPAGRDEGLECDARSFQPRVVLWSRDFNPPGRVDAIEVDPQTCRCGGITPARRSTWGQVKAIYR